MDGLDGDVKDCYPSRRALGALFREIELPSISAAQQEGRAQRQATNLQSQWTLATAIRSINAQSGGGLEPLSVVVRRHVLSRIRYLEETLTLEDVRPIFRSSTSIAET